MERFDRLLIACATAASALAALLDLALARAEAGAVAAAGVLGAGLGAVAGLCTSLVLTALVRAPRGVQRLAWSAAGLLLLAWLVQALGIAPRLLGSQRALAGLVLAISALAGSALGALGLALQPTVARPRGVLFSAPVCVRAATLLALASVTAACVAIDRTVEVGSYRSAHAVLRAMSLATFAVALWLLVDAIGARARRGVRAVAAVLAALGAAAGGLAIARAPAGPGGLWHALGSRPYSALALRAGRALSDVDGDGYGALLGGGDCAPLDARIHPGARERPGNGVDDNCLRGDAPLHFESSAPRSPRAGDGARSFGAPIVPSAAAAGAPTSVVLITIDALSAQHVGAYGYPHATTPRLDRWAARALRFERAYSTGGWTTIALSSLFRGRYPRALRWTRLLETTRYRLLRVPQAAALPPGERVQKGFALPLGDPRPTLPSLLRARGVVTSAVVDDGYTEVLTTELAAGAGFTRVEVAPERTRKRANDAAVTALGVRELRRLRAAPTFFLWLHYFGPHHPSSEHRGTPRFGTGAAAGYDHEIAHLDEQLGRLLRAIELEQQRRPVAVIVTADHGEVVRRGGRGHGNDLSEATLRIPLFVHAQGLASGASDQLASLIDVMPTVLELTGAAPVVGLDGTSLLELARRPRARVLISDSWRQRVDGRMSLDLSAAYDGRTKLVRDRIEPDEFFVDQRAPGERELDPRVDPPARALRAELEGYLERHGRVSFQE